MSSERCKPAVPSAALDRSCDILRVDARTRYPEAACATRLYAAEDVIGKSLLVADVGAKPPEQPENRRPRIRFAMSNA